MTTLYDWKVALDCDRAIASQSKDPHLKNAAKKRIAEALREIAKLLKGKANNGG
jgi:hypothetical protein